MGGGKKKWASVARENAARTREIHPGGGEKQGKTKRAKKGNA